MELNPSLQFTNKKPPAQRKTTLKWDDNGDLTAVDMARIIDRLTTPELIRCEWISPESFYFGPMLALASR